MKNEWDKFKDLICKKNQPLATYLAKQLQNPVPFPIIEELEKELGVTLPGDYKTSLRIHGGCQIVPFLGGYLYFSPSYVMRLYRELFEEATVMKERLSPRVDNGIAPVSFSRFRIPVAGNADETIYIDMAPTGLGRIGQVILCDANGNLRIIAHDFKTFFKQSVREFLYDHIYIPPKTAGNGTTVYDPSAEKEIAL